MERDPRRRAAAPAGLRGAGHGVLLVLAFPALGMRAVLSGTDDLPRNLEVMQVYDRIDDAFPGGQIPAVVTIAGEDVTAPAVQSLDQGPRRSARSPPAASTARST